MLKRIIFGFLLMFFSVGLASAQSTSITSGVNWLIASQNADYSWSNASTSTTQFTATAETLDSLRLNGSMGTSFQNGLTWLNAQPTDSANFTSARLLLRARSGLDATDDLNRLISLRSSVDDYWGLDDDYSHDPFHTSIALQALRAANFADLTTINNALAYLTSSQNPDGGWGFSAGVPSTGSGQANSNVYLTAIVSTTLQQFPQMTSISTAVSRATTYLFAHQNPDGGFGSPSTVYETALAYIALVGNGQTQDLPLQNAVNFIITNQSLSGSWNDDPYSTALALRALYLSENRPSPPPPPPSAGRFTGTVVDSISQQRVSGVTVALASNSLVNTVTDSAGNFTLPDVPPGSQKVNLSMPGFAPASASGSAIADVTINFGNIPMTSAYNTSTINGTIFDPNGAPLPDAAIAVNGSWSGSTVTAADGTFAFSYVTPGDVTITASKTGYQSFSGTGRVYARTTLAISPRLNSAQSQLTTGSIIGRVIDDLWGYPIDHLPEDQGVRVTISGGAFVAPDPDNGGKFAFTGLAPNTYQVTVGMSGFVSQTFRLIVAPGVTTDLGTIRLAMSAATMTLVGKVTDSITGLPIPGAEIVIPTTGQTARSDFAGTYAIADTKTFQFDLKVSAAGYVAKTVDLYQTGIHGSIWTQTVDVSLTPRFTKGDLTGRVIDSLTGQPLVGAVVALAGDPAVNALTGDDGVFNLPALAMGLQQATVTLDGFTPRTVGGVIFPGQVNNAGDISLSLAAQTAFIRGTVRNAVTGDPLAGVQVSVIGSGTIPEVTADDGSYTFADVPPGVVTVGMSKTGYYPARISATLAAGGLLVYSPALAGTVPVTVSATIQTDKPVYSKGDTAGINISLINRESRELAATMRLRVIAPDGATIHEAMLDAALAADGMRTLSILYPLLTMLQGGMYSISAELFDSVGAWVGAASGSFGVLVSRITVTPNLPQKFSAGTNTLLFNLANNGDLPVSAGLFTLALKDSAGQTVAVAEQPFALSQGAGKTLNLGLTIPPLAFGSYSLVYSQSDETREGVPVVIPLENSIGIAAQFDSNSHRVRGMATLTVTLTNTGRFALDAALPVTLTVPDAAFTETKSLAGVSPSGSTLVYSFTIPVTVTSGEHTAIVTATLPGGSSTTTGTKLVIFDAALKLAPLPGIYSAGDTISPIIANSGGVDAQVQYFLRLYDTKGALIADKSSSETVLAGDFLSTALLIPTGAMDGSYSLVVNYKELTTGKEEIITSPLTISGVKGALQVQTGKQSYLATESVTGLSSIINTGTAVQRGNLHLQITNAGGAIQKKSWTSQFDFQQGARAGVDTFVLPDAVTLTPVSDNFNDGLLDTDRWSIASDIPAYPPIEQNGGLRLFLPPNPKYNWIGTSAISKWKIAGDFDAMVDYKITAPWTGGNNHAAVLLAFTDNWNMRIDVWGFPEFGTVDSWGSSANSYGFPAASLQGKLRISRTGGTFISYFWFNNSWVGLLGYGNRPKDPVGFALYDFGQGGNAEVFYDNFTVTTHTYPASGTLNLKYDGGLSEKWNKLNFTADLPGGTSVKFRTRTAETDNGLASAAWSDYLTINGSSVTSPPGRWIEVETTLETTNTNITPLLHDVTVTYGNSPDDILWQTDIPVNMAQGAKADLSTTISALGTAGKYYLQGTLSSNTGQAIATTEYPFYVVQGNTLISLSPDKKLYKPGETVTINGEVTNLATVEAANLSLTVKAKAGSGASQSLYTDTFTIPAGGNRSFNVTTTAGSDGIVTLSATVAQNSATLAAVADQFEVAGPKVAASLSGPDSAGSEPVTLTLSLVNSGKNDAAINVATSFGSPAETITVAAGQTRILQYQQKLTASTAFTFTLSGDLTQQLTKTIVYVAPRLPATLSAKMVTDKLAYSAGEKVALTATITCLDAGTTGDILAGKVLIVNSSGEALFTDAISLPLPDTGRLYTNSKYWDSAVYPPGTYTARVVVDGGRVALATAEATFIILPSSATAAGVAGTLTAALNPVYLGIDQSLSLSLVNGGNEDLAGAVLSVTVVNPDTQAIMQTNAKTVAIPQQGTLTDTVLVPTASLEERDYLAVLQIILPGMAQAKTLAGAPFSVKIAPPPVLLVSTLSNGAITNNQTLNVTGSATGVVAIKSVTIKGTDVPFDSDGSFSHALLLQNGDNLISTIATDILNHTATDNRTITLDQLAPTLTIDSPADNSKTAISPIEVKGSVDETSTVIIKVKDNVQTAVMNGTKFSATVIPEPRWNTIEITATDLAGNPSSQKRSVLFDDQKPSLAITEPEQDVRTNKSSMTINGRVSDPYSAVGVTVAIDGVILTPLVVNDIFSQIVTFTEEKLYPTTVTASNEVGTQTTVQRNIIFDKTPPKLTIDPVVSPTNAASQILKGTREDGAIVVVNCATAIAGAVEYPTGTSWQTAVSGLTQGENRIQATATDLANNRTAATATILYAPKAPEVTISASPNQLRPPNKKLVPVTISGNVATFGSDIKDVTISVADEYGKYSQQGLKFGNTVLLEAWREGNDMDGRVYAITAVVTDQAGNRTTRSTTVTVPHDMGK